MTDHSQPEHRLQEPDRSIGDLVGRLTSDMGDLVTAHIDLAKAEIRRDIAEAGRGAGMLGAGAVAALVATFMLSAAAAWGLAEIMPAGFAFLIVGGLWAVAAAVLAYTGRDKLTDVDPVPQQTRAELEEDKRWLSNQTN